MIRISTRAVGEVMGAVKKTGEQLWIGLWDSPNDPYVMTIVVLYRVIEELKGVCAAVSYIR